MISSVRQVFNHTMQLWQVAKRIIIQVARLLLSNQKKYQLRFFVRKRRYASDILFETLHTVNLTAKNHSSHKPTLDRLLYGIQSTI